MVMEEYLLLGVYGGALLSSVGVVFLSNPVHSVLSLVLVFCFGGSMLLVLGVEFVAFTLILVYVGALSVLFLFVVMMLRIKEMELVSSRVQFLPFGVILFLSFVCNLLFLLYRINGTINRTPQKNIFYKDWICELESVWNTEVLAEVFFRHYVLVFLSLGFILLCAMIGAISLTIDVRGWYISGSRKQDIFMQVASGKNGAGTLLFVE